MQQLRPVWRELLRSGVTTFKCATVREAVLLLNTAREEGVPNVDLLVAYPLALPSLRRLFRETKPYLDSASISVLCEDPDAVMDVPTEFGVWLDVNPGMDRTGGHSL